MQVQAKLMRQNIGGSAEPVPYASFLEQRQVEIGVASPEHPPAHFYIAVRRYSRGRRNALFREGYTKAPPAELVPMIDARHPLEFGQVILGLLGQPYVLYGHYAASCVPKYPDRIRVSPASSSYAS